MEKPLILVTNDDGIHINMGGDDSTALITNDGLIDGGDDGIGVENCDGSCAITITSSDGDGSTGEKGVITGDDNGLIFDGMDSDATVDVTDQDINGLGGQGVEIQESTQRSTFNMAVKNQILQ